jgi:hypothetical protein
MRSATRSRALRARGLRAILGLVGTIGLPTSLSFGRRAPECRQARIHGIGQGMAAHELLDDAILERMKADDREPPVRRRRASAASSAEFEFAELVVDVDAQRLKHARRRMLVRSRLGCDARDHLRELQRALERRASPVGDDCARDARRMRSSPNSRKMRTSSASDAPLTTSAALSARAPAHAHVEGPSCMKLKPRSASSSCGEETPRSNRMPSNFSPGSHAIGAGRERREGARKMLTRGSDPNRARASATARNRGRGTASDRQR